jgi:hypothetical protein
VIVKEEAPNTLAHSVRFDPLRKEVVGYKMDATAHHYFTSADPRNARLRSLASIRLPLQEADDARGAKTPGRPP